jgi:hypothetical protein
MGRFYSPDGNYEVWDEKPAGYYTLEEWKQLHPDPEHPEPTKEEKLAQLDSQYDADVAELTRYYTEAALEDDAELQEEIKAELAEIKATYVEERKKIEEGDD